MAAPTAPGIFTLSRGAKVVGFKSADEDDIMVPSVDVASEALKVACLVYNTDTLAHEWMTQPVVNIGDLTVTMGDVEALLANAYWEDTLFDFTSGNLDYKGQHTVHKTAEGAATWWIWKYTWTSGNPTRIEGPLVGSWTNRSSLAWGA